jgi:DNA repair exonuclease SbcCD nuclease subunit
MKKYKNQIEKHKNNINNLNEQLIKLEKQYKKTGIIVISSVVIISMLVCPAVLQLVNGISYFEKALIVGASYITLAPIGVYIMKLFEEKEKELKGKITTQQSLLDYCNEEYLKEKKKQGKQNEQYIKETKIIENPTLEQLKRAKQELMKSKEQSEILKPNIKNTPVKTLTKQPYNKPNPYFTTKK